MTVNPNVDAMLFIVVCVVEPDGTYIVLVALSDDVIINTVADDTFVEPICNVTLAVDINVHSLKQ